MKQTGEPDCIRLYAQTYTLLALCAGLAGLAGLTDLAGLACLAGLPNLAFLAGLVGLPGLAGLAGLPGLANQGPSKTSIFLQAAAESFRETVKSQTHTCRDSEQASHPASNHTDSHPPSRPAT